MFFGCCIAWLFFSFGCCCFFGCFFFASAFFCCCYFFAAVFCGYLFFCCCFLRLLVFCCSYFFAAVFCGYWIFCCCFFAFIWRSFWLLLFFWLLLLTARISSRKGAVSLLSGLGVDREKKIIYIYIKGWRQSPLWLVLDILKTKPKSRYYCESFPETDVEEIQSQW